MAEKQTRRRMSREEATEFVLNIRSLLNKYGVNQTARIAGCSRDKVSKIKTGRNFKDVGALTINSLQLKRLPTAKLCRSCGQPSTLFAPSLLCVECEVLVLIRKGLVEVREES